MKRFRAVLAWSAFVLACIVSLSAAGLFLLEQTGTLARFLRERIAAELGPEGEGLSIGHATLGWFDPGLHLENVRFEAEDGFVAIDRLDVLLRGALDPIGALRSVGVAGGQVVYSPGLGERLANLGGESEEGGPSGPRRRLPRLRIRDLDFALHTPKAGDLPLGSLELIAEMDPKRLWRVSGVLHPPGAREGSGTLHVSGREEQAGHMQLRAGSLGLPLERLAIGAPRAPGDESGLRVAGILRISAEATLRLDGGEPSSAHARAAWTEGRIEPGRGLAALEGVGAELRLDYTAEGDKPYWYVPAWDLAARLRGNWNGAQSETWLLAGKSASESAGSGVEVRTRIDGFDLDADDTRALVKLVGIERDVNALGPAGQLDLAVAAHVPWKGATLDLAPQVLAHARPKGEIGLTYHGWPSTWDGLPEGIPLPATEISGHALFASRGTALDWTSALSVEGAVGPGRVRGVGSLGPPLAPGRPISLDLELTLEGAPIDDKLRRALDGMRATQDIWAEYGPSAGTLSSSWRLLRDAETVGLFAEGRIDVAGGRALWRDLPVPVEDVSGTLLFHWADRGTPTLTPLGLPSETRPFGVAFDFEGRSRTVDAVRIHGRSRQEFSPEEPQAPEPSAPRATHIRLEAENLPLRGSDWDLLAASLPDVAAEVALLQPRGKVNATYEGWQVGLDPSRQVAIEVEPRELTVQPVSFPMRTEEVRGRFSVRAGEDAEGTPLDTVIQSTVAGRWSGGAFVAASGGRPRRGKSELLVYGAGVDPANPAVQGSLSDALAEASGERVDFSALAVEGRIDVRAHVPLEEGAAEMDGGSLRIYLRDNALSLRNFGLSGLRGVLTLEDEILRGDRVQARLGSTPVELHNAAFLSSDTVKNFAGADALLVAPGLVPPERVTILQADLHARDLPLDREHMQGFLDEDSLTALVDAADLVGLVDLLGTRVLIVGDGAAGAKVVVRGDLVPHGVSLDPGLPVQVSSARVRVNRMLYEAGRLRAWAEISDVYARLAERELSGAHFVAGYADGRLTVEDLEGTFEGGRLRSLGGGRSSAAMHADLAEPFRFDLSVELESVDVDGVLEGVFPSNVRDTGRLNAQLRLSGSLADPLGLVGDGAGWISNARLWSIPVVRELFSQLGFDGTAVFDRMSFRFRLRDGVVRFPDIRARSPLLQLVGKDGKVDLDGRLSLDLEVRYSLIDNLGPINRLVYWIQNNLLRVSIRGNMARPRVLLRNALGELLGGPDLRRQDLPLPELSPLPERF